MKSVIRLFAAGLLVFSQWAFALPDGAVNVNTAQVEELAAALTGVGASRAQAIVDYREKFGSFESLEDLMAVRGIGQHVIDTNKDKIHFSE